MAMGPSKGQAATLQVEMVCLDELVPVDDRLRRLDELVDWGFVRAEAAPYYAADLGRPSIDPIVLVKLMLIGALEGIDSMRELLRIADFPQSLKVDSLDEIRRLDIEPRNEPNVGHRTYFK